MPEDWGEQERANRSTPPKTIGGCTFSQRRLDILRRLEESAEQCKLNYSGRKELATEKDEAVSDLCQALEDAFTYGLQQPQSQYKLLQQSIVAETAVNLLQNMQEIVTGNMGLSSRASVNGPLSSNDVYFWDFCQIHLTQHERERYENLKHVWTKCGRGKAFIRAVLNENSLQRYLLIWLNAEADLRRFYSRWSLLLDAELCKELLQIVTKFDNILFALTVDSTELNVQPATRPSLSSSQKEEPVINAPSPLPVVNVKHKRRTHAVERPIASANATEDYLASLGEGCVLELPKADNVIVDAFEEPVSVPIEANSDDVPSWEPEPIEPELEFLKQPLPDYSPNENTKDATIASSSMAEKEYDDAKSDTSSQYSKSSSANCAPNQNALEEKLREMSEHCALLETRVAQLTRENRQLVRRLTQQFNESGIDPTSSLSTNFLITIPHVKLVKGKHGSSYYAYEIHITMRQHLEHWSLLRRYREFYKLHQSLLRTHPSVSSVDFPPKKHFGNMNLVFVEERRQQLQIYLLNIVEILPQVEACKSKSELQKVFPFLRER